MPKFFDMPIDFTLEFDMGMSYYVSDKELLNAHETMEELVKCFSPKDEYQYQRSLDNSGWEIYRTKLHLIRMV